MAKRKVGTPNHASAKSFYSLLPSVTEVDQYLQKTNQDFGKPVRNHVHNALENLRSEITQSAGDPEFKFSYSSKEQILQHVSSLVSHSGITSVKRVINATGVVIHTNLGRSPLSKKLVESILPLLSSYSTVEYDLETGKRGSRGKGVVDQLRLLSGSEGALVVNNNAAAVYLMLMALAGDKAEGRPEVIVSRGELIEIGGSFRIPDIMRTAGVKLVEVGTTNRTRIEDYETAITEKTVALMKVHPSNYTIQGFVEEASMNQIAKLAKEQKLFSFYDLGSGNFYRFQQPQLQHMLTVQQEVRSGADLITFSGDKLLGSTQAGIIVGQQQLIKILSKHPLYRALRLDKVTMALLESHLAAYFDFDTLPSTIPTIGLLEQSTDDIKVKAETVFKSIKIPKKSNWFCELQETTSLTGGGVLPEVYLGSYALIIHHETVSVEKIQTFFREQDTPLISRVHNNQVWLDFRTIFAEDFQSTSDMIHKLFASSEGLAHRRPPR